MSLINEALKKAQKERTGEAPSLASMPPIGGEAPTRIARSRKSSPLAALAVPAGLGAAVLLVVVIGAFFLFRAKPSPTVTPPPVVAPPTQTLVETVASADPSKAAQPAETTSPAPTGARPTENMFVLPIATPSASPVKTGTEPVAEAIPVRTEPGPVAPQPVAPEPPMSHVVIKLEPRAINFIENLRVAGIRASIADSKDSKVLMNDRVYRIGNLVEPEMGLRLVGIAADSLTFEDERGGRYTRTF